MKTKIGPWMAFTLYFGAAWKEADTQQQTALRQAFHDHKESIVSPHRVVWVEGVKSFMNSVQGIMGAHWRPKGEWAELIHDLLRGDHAETGPDTAV